MKTKKILVAVTNDISTDQRVEKTCKYLLSKGYEITVYGRVLPSTFEIDRPYKIRRTKHFFNHNFLFYAEYNIRLLFFILKHKFDVILSNDLDTLSACYVAGKIKKIKLMYDSHELFSEGPELQGRKFVRGFWRMLEKLFLPKLTCNYTVSKSIGDYYDERYQNNMGVVRNVPWLKNNILEKSVSFPTENKVVLYQGVLNPGRGIKLMIDALEFLEKIDFVIIGYGMVAQELRDYVKDKKMDNRVHFMGRIPYEDLFYYTQKADVGILLEEPLGKSFEYALPNKLFDYIHAELPFVCGHLKEVTKIVSEFNVGKIIQDYTPEKVAESIRELMNNTELRNEIKSNQRQAKEILNWQNESKKLDQYFS